MSLPVREDPELGPVRLCPGCGEEWPFDDTFWHIDGDGLAKAWPSRCRACCLEYFAERRRIRQAIVRRDRTLPPRIEGRCNVVMRGGRCGRFAGHDLGHRTTLAMAEDSARHKRARAAA